MSPIRAAHAKRGFTLIELAVVIAIIAILAAVAIPRFGNTAASAECAAIKDMVAQLNSAASIYTAENAATPTAFTQFVSATALTGTAPGSPTISLATFGPKAATAGACTVGGTIECPNAFTSYSPTYSFTNGVISFTATPKTPTGGTAPAACR